MPLVESELIEITPQTHEVIIDLRYATPNNFTRAKAAIYSDNARCYLHKDAEEKLSKAISRAQELGFKLKIFDAFRPIEAQTAMFKDTPNPEFLSPPETGSIPHCRGVAVDVTLVDDKGNELDMGTGFDEFSSRAHHANKEVSQEAQKNRKLLRNQIMMAAGWDDYKNEWWHYQLFNVREKYPALSDQDAGTNMLSEWTKRMVTNSDRVARTL